MQMSKRRKSDWYGVRTLYRVEPLGRPSSQVTGVEVRVVVFRAPSHKEAIRKGEAEARHYAKGTHRNPYGISVRTRRFDHVEAFDIRMLGSVLGNRDLAIIRRLLGRPAFERSARDSEFLRCSFCNKDQRHVKKLIAGPTAYICDECIDVCLDIIAEEREPDPA